MYLCLKKQDNKIGMERDEDQALETQYTIFFSSPKEPGQCQGLWLLQLSCFQDIKSKKKKRKQDEVRNFFTKNTLSPG